MPCYLEMINEEWETEFTFPSISSPFIKKIIHEATRFDLALFPFLDDEDENIYNILQLKVMEKELQVLELNSELDYLQLKTLEKSIEKVLREKSYSYLRIFCKNDS